MAVRYLAIEQTPVSLACEAGAGTWLCASRKLMLALHSPPILGITALIAALLNLMRPSIVLMTVSIAAGGMGLVLHNAGLAGLAAGLLILSLARPVPAPE